MSYWITKRILLHTLQPLILAVSHVEHPASMRVQERDKCRNNHWCMWSILPCDCVLHPLLAFSRSFFNTFWLWHHQRKMPFRLAFFALLHVVCSHFISIHILFISVTLHFRTYNTPVTLGYCTISSNWTLILILTDIGISLLVVNGRR